MPGEELKQIWRELKEEFAPHVHKIKAFWQDNREDITSRKRQVVGYGNRLKNAITKTIMLILTITGLTAGILYMLAMLWEVYTATPMGQHFIAFFPDQAWDVYDLFDQNLLEFALKITGQSFFICLIGGVAGQVTGLIRLLYRPFGKGLRVILWGFPLTAIVASNIQTMCGMELFETALAVVLLPTLGIFSACVQFAEDLLPEGGGLIRMAAGLIARHTRQ